MTPKYVDVALIVFLAFLAVTRFMEGRTGFGTMLAVLALMNVFVLVMKIKQDREQGSPSEKKKA